METVTQSLITLAIGGFLGGVIKSLLDYRSQVFNNLWEKRLEAYQELWRIMKVVPRWPKATGVTYKKLFQMSISMRDWYYDKGGILMSQKTRTLYGNLQETINDAILKGKELNNEVIDKDEYIIVQELGSKVRSGMTNDLLSRKKQI